MSEQQPDRATPQGASASPTGFGRRLADPVPPPTSTGVSSPLGSHLTKPVDTAPSAASATSATESSSAPAATPAAAAKRAASRRRTRKARLRLTRIDPWSVMKTALLFGIAGGIILIVAVWVLWGVVQASGVFESVERAVNEVVTPPGQDPRFHINQYVDGGRVLGLTALIAAADVVIFTALATLFSFLYNLSATVLGGLEVTLAED